ncbi:hypothetical protein GCM10027062_41280 [Nocardioides hungaricus]
MTQSSVEQPPASRGELIEGFVDRQAVRLAGGYRRDDAGAVAELARLRRALPRNRTMPPEAWQIFAAGFPEPLLGHTDAPSRAELATAASMALFALHQQSRRGAPMHVRGKKHGVGAAARTLASRIDSTGVERRLIALTRADELDPVLEHLRGLVNHLRAHEIPLDYARLARDLDAIQHPEGRRGVRVRWSRDFFRPMSPQPDDTDPNPGAPA